MKIAFTKMHGLGNDFIVIDCRSHEILNPPKLAVKYSHRQLGIGADQILLLYNSNLADFKMKIFNADGSEIEMCGNGIRCLAKYIWDRGLSNKDILEIETLAGIIRVEQSDEFVPLQIKVDMGEPIFDPEKIPVDLRREARGRRQEADHGSRITDHGSQEGKFPMIDYPLRIKDREFKITFISMGNPHAVIFLDEDLSIFPVSVYGPEIENHPIFLKRTNVEFVNVKNKAELSMRVWERGAGETMACGTGASAAGVASMLKGMTDTKVTVHLLGGELVIEWQKNSHVYMTGPATEVFTGVINNI